MIMDSLLLVDDAHAYTAAAVSTNAIDLGNVTPKRQIGDGEPMGFAFAVDVAASSTTVKLEIIMATDAALTSGIVVVAERTCLSADLPAGACLFLPMFQGGPAAGWLRYIGVRVTPSGGAATVTITAWMTAQSMLQRFLGYAKGYVIA